MKLLGLIICMYLPILLYSQKENPEWQRLKLRADTTQNSLEAKKLYQQLIEKVIEFKNQEKQVYEKGLHQAEMQKKLILIGFVLAGLSILFVVFLIIRNTRQKDLLIEKQSIIEEQNQELQAQTEELRQQQEEIVAQRDDIAQKNQLLTEKNRLIQESIQVASYIQKMIFEKNSLLKNVFKDFAVLSFPKDTVSGDFYWVNKINHTTILAMIDCMGHGVPAAFISLIIHMLLKEIVFIKQHIQPDIILEKLNDELTHIIQPNNDLQFNISADISLCAINKTLGNDFQVNFSGARRPLLYSLNNEILRFKGSRHSVSSQHIWEDEYENEVIELPAKTRIFMFSDGIIDQNNFEGKKFSEQKLIETLQQNASLDLQEQVKRLEDSFIKHKGNMPQRDDILFLAIEL